MSNTGEQVYPSWESKKLKASLRCYITLMTKTIIFWWQDCYPYLQLATKWIDGLERSNRKMKPNL